MQQWSIYGTHVYFSLTDNYWHRTRFGTGTKRNSEVGQDILLRRRKEVGSDESDRPDGCICCRVFPHSERYCDDLNKIPQMLDESGMYI